MHGFIAQAVAKGRTADIRREVDAPSRAQPALFCGGAAFRVVYQEG